MYTSNTIMLDLKEELCCSVSESQSSSNDLKRCTDCQTTSTPLWRGGPAGPKTLCNACGIKYHKKRRALLGLDKGKVDKNKKKNTTTTKSTTSSSSSGSSSNNSNNNNGTTLGVPLKIKVMASRIRKTNDSLRDKIALGEVEQAAMLLMALSYGSVYA